MGINFPSPIVLHGPPGCGKTYAIERLAEFIGWPTFFIDSNSIGSPYIHDTSKKISEVFDKAIKSSPSIIIIDEMEAFLTDRRSAGSLNLYHIEEIGEFLKRIPDAIKHNVLIFAMTNMLHLIDPAILRRGRFDHIVEVCMPSKEETLTLVNYLLKDIPKNSDLNLDKVIDFLTGKALSDSSFLIREAARLAAKQGHTKLMQDDLDESLINISQEH
jgi:SpoVK/Ycf46/Vps4 family AAA+-type ATPase